MSRPISDVEVGADVEIEGDVIVVVLMVCRICAQTCAVAAYFHYRAWTPQWLTSYAFARIIHNQSDRLSLLTGFLLFFN